MGADERNVREDDGERCVIEVGNREINKQKDRKKIEICLLPFPLLINKLIQQITTKRHHQIVNIQHLRENSKRQVGTNHSVETSSMLSESSGTFVPTKKSSSKGLVTNDDCGEICGESIKSLGSKKPHIIEETTHHQSKFVFLSS